MGGTAVCSAGEMDCRYDAGYMPDPATTISVRDGVQTTTQILAVVISFLQLCLAGIAVFIWQHQHKWKGKLKVAEEGVVLANEVVDAIHKLRDTRSTKLESQYLASLKGDGPYIASVMVARRLKRFSKLRVRLKKFTHRYQSIVACESNPLVDLVDFLDSVDKLSDSIQVIHDNWTSHGGTNHFYAKAANRFMLICRPTIPTDNNDPTERMLADVIHQMQANLESVRNQTPTQQLGAGLKFIHDLGKDDRYGPEGT